MKLILEEFKSNSSQLFAKNTYITSKLAAALDAFLNKDDNLASDSLVIITELLIDEQEYFQQNLSEQYNSNYSRFLNRVEEQIDPNIVKRIRNLHNNRSDFINIPGRKYLTLQQFEKLSASIKLEKTLLAEQNKEIRTKLGALKKYLESQNELLTAKKHELEKDPTYCKLISLKKESDKFEALSENAEKPAYKMQKRIYYDSANQGYDSWVPWEDIEVTIYEPDVEARTQAHKNYINLQDIYNKFYHKNAKLLAPLIKERQEIKRDQNIVSQLLKKISFLISSFSQDLDCCGSKTKKIITKYNECLATTKTFFNDINTSEYRLHAIWDNYQAILFLGKAPKNSYLSMLECGVLAHIAHFINWIPSANVHEALPQIIIHANLSKEMNRNNLTQEPEVITFKKNNAITYIESQLERLSDVTPKYWKLIRLMWQLKEGSFSDASQLQEKLTSLKGIVSEHKDEGLKGLLKFTWLRETKSYKAFKTVIENDAHHLSINPT